MNLPGFNAEAPLGKPTRTYRTNHRYASFGESQNGMPASVLPSQLEVVEGKETEIEAGDVGIEEGDLLEEENIEEEENLGA